MARLSVDSDTLALYHFDETSVPGTGYATLVDSIASGGTARNLTETNGGAGARSPNYTHIVNSGSVGSVARLARWFPGKATSNAAFMSRAGDASSATVLTGSYTVRMWIRADTLASEVIAFTGPSESTADNCLFQLTILGTGLLQLFWEFSTGTNVNVTQTTGTGLSAGVWNYVAITVDNSGGTSTTKFYVGTSSSPQQTVTGSTKATGGTTATWFLGCSGTSPTTGFLGAVTGVCIDSVVRSGAEIAAFAALGVAAAAGTDGNTFIAWQCQEQPDAKDETAYGYHLRKIGTGGIEIVDPLCPGGGKARHCDGTIEYIGHWGYTNFINGLQNDFTFEFWGQFDSGYATNDPTGFATIGDWTDELSANNAISWDLRSTRVFRLIYEQGSGTDVSFSTSSAILATVGDGYNKHHYAFRKYNSGGSNRTTDAFLDAVNVGTITTTGDMNGGANDYLRVPVGSGSTPHPLTGRIDEMRWVKRKLTDAEILADFRSNPPVITVSPSSGSTLGQGDTIAVTVTDPDGDLSTYTAAFNLELAWDGSAHTTPYSTSSRTGVTNGFQDNFRRDGLWPVGVLSLTVNAVDTTGQPTSATFSWTVASSIDFVLALSTPTFPPDRADIELIWDEPSGSADMAIASDDVAFDLGLRTAVILSLFTDRRAQDDDEIPSGDGDKRGWWADQFADIERDRYGSRLWLLARSAMRSGLAQRVEEYDREALAWMLEDKVVQKVDVLVETQPGKVFHQVTLTRPNGAPVSFKFAHVWDGEASR